jgi:His-Xaa-Ser system radical SAM maturase HxsB
MTLWPLRFRQSGNGFIFVDDAGGWFKSDGKFLERYGSGAPSEADICFLHNGGHAFHDQWDLAYTGFAHRWVQRQAARRPLSYVILVPTLRCNLTCSYCQVSRASEQARGYDWTDENLADVLRLLDKIQDDSIKIEFQGGEPLLRLDILERIRSFCRNRFAHPDFVICTNLQSVSPDAWRFLEADDTYVSTSIDGEADVHQRQRTKNQSATRQFFNNIEEAARRVKRGHLSALPTIDIFAPPDFETLIDLYEGIGISSIYLRPVNYHGFARRALGDPQEAAARWATLHANFVEQLIDRNYRTGRFVEEYYFSYCLRRILAAGNDSHVDLRNPNFLAADYIVVDYDGTLYPTDEARMLARIGRADLSVGHVSTGIDAERVAALNESSLNTFDPDCIHCPYQPFCGTDVVDDVSRYGRIDVPRHQTWFCARQMAIFDKAFELIYRGDEPTRRSLAHWAGIGSWPAEIAPVYQ